MEAAAKVIKKEFMEKDPSTMRFTMLALVRWVLAWTYGRAEEFLRPVSLLGWGELALQMRWETGGVEWGPRVACLTPSTCDGTLMGAQHGGA